jgi:hypothetical protein
MNVRGGAKGNSRLKLRIEDCVAGTVPAKALFNRVSLAALTLLLALPWTAGAAESPPPRQARVIVIVSSSEKNDNTALSALINDSFRLELESKGVRAIAVGEHPGDDTTVAALAVKNKADFALWGTYVQNGTTIELSARWLDAGGIRTPGQARRSGVLDVSFDALVTGLVDEIMEGQRQNIAALPPAPVAAAPPQAPAPQAPRAPRAEAAAEPRVSPLAFSLGASPFIATFAALNYFPLGVSATLTGRYQVRAAGGLFGIGATTGLSGFTGKGLYAQADFSVVPIGLDVMYGTTTGSAVDFYAHLGGGPAIFSARLTTGESLSKVIPFITGGVGVSVKLFEVLALSLEAGYTCFFDSPDPIAGFAPALLVGLSL